MTNNIKSTLLELQKVRELKNKSSLPFIELMKVDYFFKNTNFQDNLIEEFKQAVKYSFEFKTEEKDKIPTINLYYSITKDFQNYKEVLINIKLILTNFIEDVLENYLLSYGYIIDTTKTSKNGFQNNPLYIHMKTPIITIHQVDDSKVMTKIKQQKTALNKLSDEHKTYILESLTLLDKKNESRLSPDYFENILIYIKESNDLINKYKPYDNTTEYTQKKVEYKLLNMKIPIELELEKESINDFITKTLIKLSLMKEEPRNEYLKKNNIDKLYNYYKENDLLKNANIRIDKKLNDKIKELNLNYKLSPAKILLLRKQIEENIN